MEIMKANCFYLISMGGKHDLEAGKLLSLTLSSSQLLMTFALERNYIKKGNIIPSHSFIPLIKLFYAQDLLLLDLSVFSG